jgi:CO dehydrogenase maturation factor
MVKQPEPYVITIVGKGGAGKTTITYFLAQDLISHHTHFLLIDADPTTSHLARLLGISPATTIEHLRRNLVDVAARGDTQEKALIAKNLDEIVSKSVIRMPQYDLLVMGQPELAGCFCPSNTLLRAVIEKIVRDYDVVLVDCEAGMEQIHRQVIRQVNYVIIIAENTIGSLQTASQILRAAEKFTHYSQAGLILNKIQSPQEVKLTLPNNLPLLGTIPLDPILNEFERKGLTLKDLPSDSLIQFSNKGF